MSEVVGEIMKILPRTIVGKLFVPNALEVSQNPFMPNLPNRCGKMTKPGDLGIMDDGKYVRRKCRRIFCVTQVLILMTCKVMYTEKVILTTQ